MRSGILSSPLKEAIEQAIVSSVGGTFSLGRAWPVGGGCISRNFRIEGDGQVYFVKCGGGPGEIFAAESDGLVALSACQDFVIPQVVAAGRVGDENFLVLEWLDLQSAGDEARLGEALARLHFIRQDRHGWHRQNFIGATHQDNTPERDWPTFFARRRLLPQLELAARNGAPDLREQAEPLLASLPDWLPPTAPVLLHGDLWRGNVAFVRGRPALFDPAVHAGDAETDIAMTQLFGGFSERFLVAYRAVHPPPDDVRRRHAIYQLYHVLNHFNLFGGSYRVQAKRLIDGIRGFA